MTIDLKQFCDEKEGPRYSLNHPWVKNGSRFATNGRIIVAVPAIGEPDTSEGRFPKVEEILKPIVGEWLPWPKVEPCRKCAETGLVIAPCGECGGDGQHECSCGCVHDCGCCQGTGKSSDVCDCRTYSDKIEIDGGHFARHYAARISALPNAEYAARPGSKTMIRFRFDGGEGALMGLSREDT